MLTKVAINRQNFNYQAFADLLENYENEFAKDRSSANYNCSDMSITLGDGFVVVNYLVSRNNLDGTRGSKQHRFMFVSGSLTFKNGHLSDFSHITMQQLLESEILSLTDVQYSTCRNANQTHGRRRNSTSTCQSEQIQRST